MPYINGIKRQLGNPFKDYAHGCPKCKQRFFIAEKDMPSDIEEALATIECPECHYMEIAIGTIVCRG